MKRTLAAVIPIVFAAGAAVAQTPGPPRFDVISIKPSDPLSRNMQSGLNSSGDFYAKGVTVKTLIQQAWDVRPFQISGGPGWLDTDRYEIVTKGERPGPSEEALAGMTEEQRDAVREQLMAKLRALLEERFQLNVHRETKDLPIYVLSIAKSGAKLQNAKDDGTPGNSLSVHRDDTGKSEVTGKKLPLPFLVKVLSDQVGRNVVDQTGLKGAYDFKMTFAPDLAQRPPDGISGNTALSPAGSDGPSIFTALQEQLGLKLDAQKGPVEVLVIDGVQKPSEN